MLVARMAHGDYGDVAAEDLYKAALSVEPSDAVTLYNYGALTKPLTP